MSTGRPKSSSQETLAEAACELFLEQGYEKTTIAQITARAGVSRSSFFNYFGSKGDILWSGMDSRIAALEAALERGREVSEAVRGLADRFAPDSLALAIVNAAAMEIEDDLVRESSRRGARIATAVAARLRREGMPPMRADVAGAAVGGAVLASVTEWAAQGAGKVSLAALLAEALHPIAHLTSVDGADVADAAADIRDGVRQLRVVARADDFVGALAFYRDVMGMREQESYEGEGGARVAILDAGRATLELSNAAQIDLIDRVETDGDAPSDRVRIAFEVADTSEVLARATAAGAILEATARVTPWNSLNARVRAPAGLQVTLFQELEAQAVPEQPLP